jgi:hypothetical protein
MDRISVGPGIRDVGRLHRFLPEGHIHLLAPVFVNVHSRMIEWKNHRGRFSFLLEREIGQTFFDHQNYQN